MDEQNSEIKTYVTPTDIITVNGGTLPAGGLIEGNIINVQDRVAPVLMSGTFFSDKQDSLQVEFSEPIDQFSSRSRSFHIMECVQSYTRREWNFQQREILYQQSDFCSERFCNHRRRSDLD